MQLCRCSRAGEQCIGKAGAEEDWSSRGCGRSQLRCICRAGLVFRWQCKERGQTDRHEREGEMEGGYATCHIDFNSSATDFTASLAQVTTDPSEPPGIIQSQIKWGGASITYKPMALSTSQAACIREGHEPDQAMQQLPTTNTR